MDAARVFGALTDADALIAWLPPKGMRGRFERFDMREGGSYHLVLTYDDASGAPGKTSADSDVSEVRISRLKPGELVAWDVDFDADDPKFQGTMRMEWTLRPEKDGTEVTVTASHVPAGVRASDHAAGLTSSLANLAAWLEPSLTSAS